MKITLGSAEAFAQLDEKDAPKATKWLKEMLPIERQAMHSMENGREVYVVLDAPHHVEEENQTIYQTVGDLIVYYKPAIFVKPEWPRHIRDILVIGFIYERDSAIRSLSAPLATNLVGKITEGIDALAREAPRMRREGFGKMSISVA
ncbi:MAG TPA: cyclophilin-like fold protein [bacterium]|nr:cyclophilin-like fold protein [bacterium]